MGHQFCRRRSAFDESYESLRRAPIPEGRLEVVVEKW